MTVTSPTSDPSESTPPVRKAATMAPTSANGSVRKTSVANRRRAEVGEQDQEDGDDGADAEQRQARRRCLPFGVLARTSA